MTCNHTMGESEIKETTPEYYLSIVIPTWNEEKRLPQTLQKITLHLQTKRYSAEIIVVDDGSTDNTVRVAQEFAQKYPSVRIICNDHRGKAYTVRTGMLAAQGEYILFTDADGATPIGEVDKLLPFLEQGYDVAIASREGAEARRYNEP
ncbi:MAG: glycosyltransferase, partial [Chloroflexi bacterium]|nr:glycosyltransferase [Chloroflexota bacterium]